MKKQSVAIVRNAYAHDFGGGERFPVFLAIQLRHHFQPVIISRSEKLRSFARSHHIETIKGLWWSQQNWSGWRISLTPIYLAWQIILTLWYLSVFIKLRPVIVHIQSKDDFIAASLAGRIVGARVIWTDHADLKHVWLNVERPFRNITGKIVLWAARFAHVITLVSKSELSLVSAQLLKHASTTAKFVVVHNGVEDRYTAFPRHHEKEIYTFCVASRLVIDKGIGEVIEAFRTVAKQHQEARLVIMGDGPDAALFKDQADSLQAVTFLGHVNQPLDIMSRSNAFVHPTYHEGFSVALVEASMMELPIIATDVGGNPEIIKSDQTGILIPAKDTSALVGAMERLLSNSDLGTRLGSSAREQYLREFEFTAIVKKYFLPLYNKD